ncbi:MAG: hypothetical protein NT038_08015 [Euryarchaeota archaeon]|nr:hypothetical protein [Euryarchaeota archaeon]
MRFIQLECRMCQDSNNIELKDEEELENINQRDGINIFHIDGKTQSICKKCSIILKEINERFKRESELPSKSSEVITKPVN